MSDPAIARDQPNVFGEPLDEPPKPSRPPLSPERGPQPTARRHRPAWVPGLVLVLIGLAFLAQSVAAPRPDNWWAFFLLIPAATSLAAAWDRYQRSGRLGAARGGLIGGIVLLTVAAIFLLGLDWGAVWPVFLIIAGLSALLAAVSPR